MRRWIDPSWMGAALLALTALVHLIGLATLPAAPSITDAPSFHRAVLFPLWLFAGVHWLVIGALCAVLATVQSKAARIARMGCGGVILLDAAVLYGFIGLFIGVWLLAAAGALIILAAVGRPVLATTAAGEG